MLILLCIDVKYACQCAFGGTTYRQQLVDGGEEYNAPMAHLPSVHNAFSQSLLPLSPSPPHPSLPHTMLVHHSTSPALFSSFHKWTLLSSLTPCGLDQEDRSPVVLIESHSPLVSTRPLYSSILSTPLILECTTVQLVFLHQVSSMWTPQ